MASLSLPRVLQQRKTSLELERENFEKFQALSIGKAVNQVETPVKEKHVRSAIIGTFHEKSAATFWACVLRLPLQDNRIVAWKFCHVLHKVLREGHPQALPSSQRHKEQIENLGKLWCHLKEGYGKLIQNYCNLLITKLNFHRRNPRFPGNLAVTKEELVNIGENDINNYFQMSVEMFDYMDDILNLQAAIFGSLDMSRSNSMTSSGQCRLAPLIPCIQDSSQLYDYCVKILFKLHASLPPDTLSGHRERFLKQFRELRQFYLNANTMQYFKNLITVPLLPENPPNFLVQSDLRSYVTPVVILPPEDMMPESEVVDGTLIDTSDSGSAAGDMSEFSYQRNGSISPDALVERDNLIEHLQQELLRCKMEMSRMMQEHQRTVELLTNRITLLETDLATRDSELEQERQIRRDLLQHTEDVSASRQETEKKNKTFEEKFNKLKEVYTKLREEHIHLIRQKAAVDKEVKATTNITTFARAANDLISSIKADVDKQLISAKSVSEEAERAKAEIEAKLQEASHEKSRYDEILRQSVDESQSELVLLRTAQEATKTENLTLSTKVDWALNEKTMLEDELQDLLSQKEELDVRLAQTEERMKALESRLLKENTDKLYKLLVTCVTEAENTVQMAVHEIDNPALSAVTCTPDYFESLVAPVIKCLDSLEQSFANFHQNPSAVEALFQNVTKMSHLLATYMINGKTTSNTSPDIEFGEQIAEVSKQLGGEALSLLACVKDRDHSANVEGKVASVKTKARELAAMIDRLTVALKGDSVEAIGDLVESELASMDKAIEEAAKRIEEMLSKSRQADSGIKLEVNEKILDSCTNLMEAVRILIQKSRVLQGEIVAQGRGTATAKEFYKRNHQWTEGLLSASKAVAMGAKFLLTAADKVVSGQGKFEQLVVASQEIAASTAQLVVASRVKADRKSANLQALSQASKSVTQATGGVVATAKSCGQMVEEDVDLDVSHLSLHQAKRLEMEAQVHVLELESSLQQERLRLSALRRHHYQLAGEVEGWEQKDIQDQT